jgi:hypothetical protein
MTRLLVPFVLVVLAGCASSGASSGAVRVSGPIGDSYPNLKGTLGSGEVPSSAAKLDVAPAAAWTALVKVYNDLKIPATNVDNADMVIASMEQRTSRVGGHRVLDYVDCPGTYGSENTYDVYLTVRTQLRPAEGGGTTATTQVIGTAKPPLSSSRIQCASSGGLEQMIAAKLREALGAPAAG